MKFVKFLPAMAASAVLAACSTASDMASSVTNTVSDAASAVGNTVSDAASATGNAVKSGVHSMGEAASATGTAMKDGMTSMKNAVMGTSKTVVYTCQNNNVVVASYSFDGNKATGVTLTVNNKAVKGLSRDDSNKDLASFASKTHVWNVDTGFDLASYNQKAAVNLYKKGKKSDEILAKDCSVNVEATAKLNK